MKSSMWQGRYFGSTGRRVAMALAVASLTSGLFMSPALADNGDHHGQDRGVQGDHSQRGRFDRRYENHRPEHRPEYRPEHRPDYRSEYRPEYRRAYRYAQPIYVPPPVYYEPRQSSGISLFFPLDLR